MSRTALRALGALCLVLVVIVYSGTFMESHWTGSMASCERPADDEASTFETGEASMRWIPPAVHCDYGVYYLGGERLVSSTDETVAVVGIAVVTFVVGCAAILAMLVLGLRAFVRRARRRAGIDSARSS